MKRNIFLSKSKTTFLLNSVAFTLFALTPLLFFQKSQNRLFDLTTKTKVSNLFSKTPNHLNLNFLWVFPVAFNWLATGWSLFKGLGNVFKTIQNSSGMIYAYGVALFGINLTNTLMTSRLSKYTKDVLYKNPNYKIDVKKSQYFPETSFNLPNSPSKLNTKLLPNPNK